jgi:hypothetical protein
VSRVVRLGLALWGLACLHPAAAVAQGYRLRLDSRLQHAAYRGVQVDSIPLGEVIVGPGGGLVTPDGFAVRCGVGAAFCRYFPPGPIRKASPMVTSADITLWRLGLPGLSIRASGRLGVDLGDEDLWPGTSPDLQLIEGYAEYAARRGNARLGRQLLSTRLGLIGFDGVRASGRLLEPGLQLEAYAGLGLARASALPVTSPALDPLDEFQPRRRGLLVGGAVGYGHRGVDLRLDYQREVGRDPSVLFAERIALSGSVQPLPQWSLTAGADYDLANTWVGNADATVRFTSRLLTAQAGLRQYRPHFDLWTIWGAFSPVPYHAVHGTVWLTPVPPLQLRGRWERFAFSEAEVTTALVQVDNDGWRLGVGATYTPLAGLTLDVGYHEEYGPGASSNGVDGNVSWRALPTLALSAYGSTLERPLEFRFNEADVWVFGLEAEWEPTDRLRLALGGAHYQEDRERPDAATLDWNQTRLNGRVTMFFGSGADRTPLPPALRTRPRAGVSR